MMMRRFLYVLGLLCAASPASAADMPPASQQLNDAYQQVLKNPQDQATLENYARIATDEKNYEAAIPPLESLLMSNPDDAELKVRIGELYMKLGSTDMAKQYFEEAQSTDGASQETKDKAAEHLHEL